MTDQAISDQRLRKLLALKIEEIGQIVLPDVENPPQNDVLWKVSRVLTGEDIDAPNVPRVSTRSGGPVKTVKKIREKGRRDVAGAAYNTLKEWIVEKRLATVGQLCRRMTKCEILDIVLEQLRLTTSEASSSNSSSSTPSSSSSFSSEPSDTATTKTHPFSIDELLKPKPVALDQPISVLPPIIDPIVFQLYSQYWMSYKKLGMY